MEDDDDFLAAVEADNEVTPAEPLVEVTVVEAPPEPAPEPTPETAETPEQPLELTDLVGGGKAEPGFVPLGALLDTRDKLKAAEARAQQLEQEQAQARAQQQQPTPDMFEDPEAFQAAIANQIHQTSLNTRLDLSEDFARSRYDDATVDAARDWALAQAKANPVFGQQLLTNRNPYDFAVREHKRVSALEKLGSDPGEVDQFLAWKAAQAEPAAAPAAPPTQTSLPPRSLASAPSAGGVSLDIVQSDEEIFNEVVGKTR